MAVSLLNARVKFAADKVWQSKQPDGKDYVSLKCELLTSEGQSTGNDAVIYANVGSAEQSVLAAYRKGDPVQLAFDGKKYSIVGAGGAVNTASKTTPPPQAATVEKPTMEVLKKKALLQSELYYEIYSDLLMRGMQPEQAQPAASTVFIQLAKNL